MEVVVVAYIGALVPGGASRDDDTLYAAFLHQITYRTVHGRYPQSGAGAFGAAEQFPWREGTVHTVDDRRNRGSLPGLPFRC